MLVPRPARTLAVIVSLCLALPLLAQKPQAFDPDRDLEGYLECSLSEFSDVYALAEFATQKGKPLAEAELEGLRTRWKAERERVAKEVARIQADPREKQVHTFSRQLARHSYFSKIDYVLERPEPGLVVLVQRPPKEDPTYVARVVGFHLPFVKQQLASFERDYVAPLGLQRRPGHEVVALAILASKGDMTNADALLTDAAEMGTPSTYDYTLKLAVTCEDAFANSSAVATQRSELLFHVARQLLHAHLGVTGNRPGSAWLDTGLAGYLSYHEKAAPESLAEHPVNRNAAGWVVWSLQESKNADLLLQPVDVLAGLRSYAEFAKLVRARAKAQERTAPSENVIYGALWAQATLWMNYLHDGAKGLYRPQLMAFVKSAMTGRGDAEDLRRAFMGTDLVALSRDFVRFAAGEHERLNPGKKVDRAPIEQLFSAVANLVAGPGTAPPGSPPPLDAAPVIAVPASFSPASLAPDPADVEAQHALALLLARKGDLEGAERLLRELAPASLRSPWDARVARELARIGELGKLREGYLAFLATSKGRLAFQHKGKEASASVLALEGGQVKLGESKSGVTSLSVADVDPYEVAKQAGKKESQGAAQPWARAYAYLLAGDERWTKVLKEETPAVKELREDAQAFYPAQVEAGHAALELVQLSRQPLPRERGEAKAVLERVRALASSAQKLALVRRKAPDLRQLAMACLALEREGQGASGLLGASVEKLGDERTRITWDFDTPQQGRDWRKLTGYLKTWREAMGKVLLAEEASQLVVAGGRLKGSGANCYSCALSFDGPLRVELKYVLHEAKGEYSPMFYDYLLFCDDGEGDFVLCDLNGDLEVRDQKEQYMRRSAGTRERGLTLEQVHTLTVEFDGTEIRSNWDGAPVATIGCGPRRSGRLLLWAHSDLPISYDSIEVEGRIEPASLRELERTWVAERLRELGLP